MSEFLINLPQAFISNKPCSALKNIIFTTLLPNSYEHEYLKQSINDCPTTNKLFRATVRYFHLIVNNSIGVLCVHIVLSNFFKLHNQKTLHITILSSMLKLTIGYIEFSTVKRLQFLNCD